MTFDPTKFPAFPVVTEKYIHQGMTLAEYYAGQALAGLCVYMEKPQTPESAAIVVGMASEIGQALAERLRQVTPQADERNVEGQ